MGKIPGKRVPSDDCVVHVGQVIRDGKIAEQGQPYPVHEGEWVEVLPIATVREAMAVAALQGFAGKKPDEMMNGAMGSAASALSGLCEALSERILAWNWTDNTGEPLPSPYHKPDVIKGLSNDEVAWLVATAYSGESPGQRKNA